MNVSNNKIRMTCDDMDVRDSEHRVSNMWRSELCMLQLLKYGAANRNDADAKHRCDLSVCSIDFDGCGIIVLYKDHPLYYIFSSFLLELNPSIVFSGSTRAFGQYVGSEYEQKIGTFTWTSHVKVFKTELSSLLPPQSLNYIEAALDKPMAQFGPYKDKAVLHFSETMTLDETVKQAFGAECDGDDQTVSKYIWMFKQMYFAHDIHNHTTIQKHVKPLNTSEFLQNFEMLGKPLIIPPQRKKVPNPNYFPPTQKYKPWTYDSDDDDDDDEEPEEIDGEEIHHPFPETIQLNLFTQCVDNGGMIEVVSNKDRYTEVCYIFEEKDGNHVYKFYRNCSKARMNKYRFTFVDDFYSKAVFEKVQSGYLPLFDSSITVELVHFAVDEIGHANHEIKKHNNVTLKLLTN